MILPHPESDLTLNVMVMASDLTNLLHEKGDYVFEETLMKSFMSKDKRRTPEMFIDCLTFLYALDIIDHSVNRLRLRGEALKQSQQLSLEMVPDA